MPISGLVITLDADSGRAAQAIADLSSRSEVTVGVRQARHLPVVVDTVDAALGCALHDWIGSLPGVDFVDVVTVHFEEMEDG